MAERWIAEPKPSADLIEIDLAPVQRGDGATIQMFRTKYNVVHARVIEASGQVVWMQKVAG